MSQSEQISALLIHFKTLCKEALIKKQQLPIYVKFSQKFNPTLNQFQIQSETKSSLNFTTFTLPQITRLFQLVDLCIRNLRQGKCMTKRSLFYNLCEYYSKYDVINTDLRLLCFNLTLIRGSTVTRNMLGIIASGRGLIFGRIQIEANGSKISKFKSAPDLIMLPASQQIVINYVPPETRVLIVEKESIFFQIMNILKKHSYLTQKYLLITAKGYPDYLTRYFLLKLTHHIKDNFYYCGDYDVYGMDIFLFYAFGNWSCKGTLEKIRLLKFNECSHLFGTKKLELMQFSENDMKKMNEILLRDYFQYSNISSQIKQIYVYLLEFKNKKAKCELEEFVAAACSPIWFHHFIEENKKH